MSILYLDKHRSCFNYKCGKEASIHDKTICKGEACKIQSNENTLLFIMSGELSFYLNKKMISELPMKNIVLIPANSEYLIKGKKQSKVTIVRMPSDIQLCNTYSLEKLYHEGSGEAPNLYPLEMNKCVIDFFKTVQIYTDNGLRCNLFFDIKIKELFFILRGFYEKEKLYNFFYPILSNDTNFSLFIQKNYKNVKTVQEFAELANYSRSGFIKKFKKAFGVSAYQWMKEQKAKQIYQDLNSKSKSIKEISADYGFTSPAHLNLFCKEHFNETPGNIRNHQKEESLQ